MTRSRQPRCAWILDRGYSKGEQCGNQSAYTYLDQPYCYAHLAMAQDPARAPRQPALRQALLDRHAAMMRDLS
jgi:hypothetical protein